MLTDCPRTLRDERLFNEARAVLNAFSECSFITMAEDPFDKEARAIMARVHPIEHEIWDFRCLDPRPGLRILGCFAETDVFVALTWDYRENFDNQWDEQVRRCKKEWERLFAPTKPHAGKELSDYVSTNFQAV